MLETGNPTVKFTQRKGRLSRRAFLTAAAGAVFVPLEKRYLSAELLERHGVPGAAFAALRNGKVAAVETSGARKASSREPVGVDTVFEAASLTKPVFAHAVFPILDLDKPLTSYLPLPYAHDQRPWRPDGESEIDWVDDPRLHRITAETVLTHTTGFPNWAFETKLELQFTPGERWQYSGEGFVLLQRVVERVTGKHLDTYLKDSLFEPIEMTSSSLVWRTDFEGRFASGHDRSGAPREKSRPVRALAAGSLHTTIGDYARFLEALFREDRLRDLAEPRVKVDASLGLSWGLSWGIEQRGEERFAWHWGSNPGFQCFVMASPSERSGFIVLTNSENGLRLARALAEEFYPGDHPVFRFRMLNPTA